MESGTTPDRDYLLARLRYDPEAGKLYWLPRTPDMFRSSGQHTAEHTCKRWNSRCSGKEAFTAGYRGYRAGGIDGHMYLAHRIIWKIMTGEDADEVDHGDGKRSNNRWENLTDTDSLGNHRNMAITSRNTSGVMGVCWHKRTARWRALGTIGGKQIALGYFHDFDEAVAARLKWQNDNGFHENHGRKAA